jgi:hypothetical protein
VQAITIDEQKSGTKAHVAHHGISLREMSCDNLIQNIHILSKIHHGISIQDLAAGNVIRASILVHGTIECHRGMPYDTVRTNIDVRNLDGVSGGALGPYAGRRMVSWNIRCDPAYAHWPRSGLNVFLAPEQYASGFIVGITGLPAVPRENNPWGMPSGDKGTIVADFDKEAIPLDLYEAQKIWWDRQQ